MAGIGDIARLMIVIKAIDEASRPMRAAQQATESLKKSAASFAIAGTAMVGAGVGIAYALKETIEPAMAVESQIARLKNTLPAGAQGMRDLADAQKASAAMSTQWGISQVDAYKALYLGTSAGFDMTTAIAGANVVTKLAIGLGGDLEETQRLVNKAYINFKNPAQSAVENFQNLGNVMAVATNRFDYKNIGELNAALEIAAPTATQLGTSFRDTVVGISAFQRAGLVGATAGEAFTESLHGVLQMQAKLGIALAYNAKGGIDYVNSIANVRASLVATYGSLAAIPPQIQARLESVFGIRGMRVILAQKADIARMNAELGEGLKGGGALTQYANTILATPAQQFAVLSANISQFFIQLGTGMLPALVSISQHLIPIVKSAAAFAHMHPQWIKMATVGLVIASGVLVLGGALALASSAVMGFVAAAGAIGFLLTPIGMVAAGIVGVAFAARFVIQHWQAVKDFFKAWGPEVLEYLLFPFLKIPLEIYKHIDAIKNAAAAVAHAIAGFFVGHSPVPMGPLRDLDMARTISETFRPSQVMTAARAAAAAIALSVPLAISPVAAAASMPAASATMRSGAAPVVVNLNVSYTINGVASEDLKKVLDKHGYELAETLNRELTRRSRKDY